MDEQAVKLPFSDAADAVIAASKAVITASIAANVAAITATTLMKSLQESGIHVDSVMHFPFGTVTIVADITVKT